MDFVGFYFAPGEFRWLVRLHLKNQTRKHAFCLCSVGTDWTVEFYPHYFVSGTNFEKDCTLHDEVDGCMADDRMIGFVMFDIPLAYQNLAKRVWHCFGKMGCVMVVDPKHRGRTQLVLYMEKMLKEGKIH